MAMPTLSDKETSCLVTRFQMGYTEQQFGSKTSWARALFYRLLNGRILLLCFGSNLRDRTFIPQLSQDLATVLEMPAVGREDLQGDGAIIPVRLKGTHIVARIQGTCTQRQVQIGAAAFVIVQMDVLQSLS